MEAAPRPSPGQARLLPLDVMRGLVMVLMALDHSSEAFNAGRLMTDSAFLYRPGTDLPTAQFLTRWVTHLCAPTFVFLAGTGLAFTVRKEIARGTTQLAIDRYILIRGAVIAGFELWISAFVMPQGMFLLQVLYAIGTSYLLMIPLRRIPYRIAGVLALLFIVFSEALTGLSANGDPSRPPLLLMLLLVGGRRPHLIIAYPTLHWLALLLLGWSWGSRFLDRRRTGTSLWRTLAIFGLALLAGFVAIRGLNGYGNMFLLRENGSLVQWLHVSKYPPSASFVSLELGLASVILSSLFWLSRWWTPREGHPLVVLGQTPMFFYILHFPLLVVSARALGVSHTLGLGAAYAGALVVVAALYPACRFYGRYKARHKSGWARYI